MLLNSSELVTRLLSLKLATPNTIVGCSEHEIAKVEKSVRMRLPMAYKDFLRAVGKKAGVLFVPDRMAIFYPTMLTLNALASRTLSFWEDGSLSLPEDAFVFSERYGEQFLFFHCDGVSENPAIYRYYEEQGYFDKIADHFWDCIENDLISLERLKKEAPESPAWDYFRSFL